MRPGRRVILAMMPFFGAVFACSSNESSNATAGDAGEFDASPEAPTHRDAGTAEEVRPGCNGGAAPDPVTYDITVIEPPNFTNPLPGATVEVLRRADRSVITTATSDSNGKVTFSAPTGGVALDALVRTTAPAGDAGPRTPMVFELQHGMQTDKTIGGLGVAATSFLAGIASDVGVTFDPAKTMVQVGVSTCTGLGVAGATVAIGDATVFYNRTSPVSFDTSATKTGITGIATAFNVTPGPTKITVTLMDGETMTHETSTVAGEQHLIIIGQ